MTKPEIASRGGSSILNIASWHCIQSMQTLNEGFLSINKKMLDAYGSSTKEDTIIALWFIKDELILSRWFT